MSVFVINKIQQCIRDVWEHLKGSLYEEKITSLFYCDKASPFAKKLLLLLTADNVLCEWTYRTLRKMNV